MYIMKEIKSAAIVGMGALGMLYANLITASLGSDSVFFVADPDRIEKYKGMTFFVNGVQKHFSLVSSESCPAVDLVIVAVKFTALRSALDTMKHCVGPDTSIISVLNGITSEQIIGERFGMEHMVYCVAQGMDAVKFGGDLTYTLPGELRIGILRTDGVSLEDSRQRLDAITHYLTKAGVAYTVEKDILYRMWGKFMLNVGVNQTCMAFETTYGGVLVPGKTLDTMKGAMREVIALANANGIPLTEADLEFYVGLMHTMSPDGMPSMRQDGIAHRPSEVELFAGTVRKMASSHGIPVPVNDWLYKRIKELEATY